MQEQKVVMCRVAGPQICVFLCRLYENKGEADFVESLVQLFRSISDMMSGVSDQTVRVKVGPRGSVDHTQGPALRGGTPCRPGKAGSACPSKPGLERKVQERLCSDHGRGPCNGILFASSGGPLKCCPWSLLLCKERFSVSIMEGWGSGWEWCVHVTCQGISVSEQVWEAEAVGAPGIRQTSGWAVLIVVYLGPSSESGRASEGSSLPVVLLFSPPYYLFLPCGPLGEKMPASQVGSVWSSGHAGVEVPGGGAWGGPRERPRTRTLASIPVWQFQCGWLTAEEAVRVVCAARANSFKGQESSKWLTCSFHPAAPCSSLCSYFLLWMFFYCSISQETSLWLLKILWESDFPDFKSGTEMYVCSDVRHGCWDQGSSVTKREQSRWPFHLGGEAAVWQSRAVLSITSSRGAGDPQRKLCGVYFQVLA